MQEHLIEPTSTHLEFPISCIIHDVTKVGLEMFMS